MTLEADDSWLEKKSDGLEHQYSLRPDQLAQSVDDIGLLQTDDEPADPEPPDDDAEPATSPFRVGSQSEVKAEPAVGQSVFSRVGRKMGQGSKAAPDWL